MTESNSLEVGVRGGADLVAGEGQVLVAQATTLATPATAPATVVIEVAEGSILRLPLGTSIDQPRVNGADLEFVQADGSVIVVPNGAVQGLTIFIGDVEIPPVTVAALFEANGIQTAAGPDGGTSSSGGNFERPVGDIGPALPFGGLLPPTALAFGQEVERELYPANLAPTFSPVRYFGRLSEEGLSGGNLDDSGFSDTTDAVSLVGSLGVTDPNGDPMTFTFGPVTAALTSNGIPLVWVGAGTPVLIGYANGAPVIVATVSGGGGGTATYTVTVLQPLDHPIAGIEDEIQLDLTIVANDGQGGTATATLTLTFEDDSPVFNPVRMEQPYTVDEDGLAGGVGDSGSPGDAPGNSSSVSGVLGIRWGADSGDKGVDVTNPDGSYTQDDPALGGRAVYFSSAAVAVVGAAGAGLTSGGLPITWALDSTGTKLIGSVAAGEGGGRPVIEVTLSDEAGGRFNFKLLDKLDHALSNTEDDITLTFSFTARDADGDTVGGTFVVRVDDDMPVIRSGVSGHNARPIVDEDDIDTAQSTGNHPNDGNADGSYTGNPALGGGGPAFVSGSFSGVVNFGADGPGGFGLVDAQAATAAFAALGLKSQGALLSYGVGTDGDWATFSASAGERPVFEFRVNTETGAYEFRLFDQLDHDAPVGLSDENFDLQDGLATLDVLGLDFGSIVRAYDGDGDYVTLTNQLTVAVRDDVPELVRGAAIHHTVDEGDIQNGQSKGSSPQDGNADGSYTQNPGDDQPGAAHVFGTLNGLVRGGSDEHPDGSPVKFSFISEASIRSTLTALGLESKGHVLSYDVVGNRLYAFVNAGQPGVVYDVGADRLVFELVVQPNGSYDFYLHDQLDHEAPVGGAGATKNTNLVNSSSTSDVNAIDFGQFIKATDYDGDSVVLKGGLSITIRDDVPEADIDLRPGAKLVLDETIANSPQDTSTDPNAGDEAGVVNPFAAFGSLIAHAKGGAGQLFDSKAQAGADEAATIRYALRLSSDGADSGINDTASGDNINLYKVGNDIYGRVGDSAGPVSFVIRVDPSTGEVRVYQYRAVEHDNAGSSSAAHDESGTPQTIGSGLISLTQTVTDADGDTATDSVDIGRVVQFEDDGPSASNGSAVLDDDAQSDGIEGGPGDAAGGSVATGTLTFNAGADGLKSLSLETGVTVTNSAGVTGSHVEVLHVDPVTKLATAETVTFQFVANPAGGGTLYGFTTHYPDADKPALTLVVDGAGAYQLTLHAPLKHPFTDADNLNNGPESAFEDNLTLNFAYKVTDGDNDTASATLSVTVNDDTPEAYDEVGGTVDEGDVLRGQFDFAGGADGATVTHVNGVLLDFYIDGWSHAMEIGSGSIRVRADGQYKFYTDSVTTSPVAPVIGTFTVTDGDGDQATANFEFQVLDGNVPTGGSALASVDDDGLIGNNPSSVSGDDNANSVDLDGNEAVFTGVLGGWVGDDAPGTFSFAALDGTTATVGQETVELSWAGNVLTATVNAGDRLGTVLFTVEVTDPATGAYVVTLRDNVLHTAGPNNEDNVQVQLGYVITDGDGSSAAGALTIDFDDDAPTATADTNSVNEGASVSGNVLTDGVADAFGADGGHIAGVRADGTPADFTTAVSGGVGSQIAGNYGFLTLLATGGYTYTSTANAISGAAQDVFVYSIVDGDGDVSTATLTINLSDVTVTATDTDAVVNEAGLPVVGSDAASASEIANGSITPNGGSGPYTYALTNPAAGAYGNLVLNADGTYTYTLTGPYDGATANNGVTTEPGRDSFGYTVTDANGNTASGTIVVNIVDDVPKVSVADADLGSDGVDAVDGAQSISGAWSLVGGADGVLPANFTVIIDGGAAIQVQYDSGIAIAGKGILTIASNNTWTFQATSVASNTSVNFRLSATDGDGDVATDLHTINIANVNQPLTLKSISLGVVEEEHGLAGGIDDATSGTSPTDLDADVPGDLNQTTNATNGNFATAITGGNEGALSFNFAPVASNQQVYQTDGNALMAGGKAVYFGMQGNNLIGYTNAGGGVGGFDAADTKIFTLTLQSNGAYTFTLNAPVDHPVNSPATEDAISIRLDGMVRVTDAGGPAADTNVAIKASVTVIDDVPVAKGETYSVTEGTKPSVNIVLVIDTSGSMADDGDPSSAFQSRLALAKQAAINLLSTSDATIANVMVVDFWDNTQVYTVGGNAWQSWATNSSGITNFINTRVTGGGTNFDAATQAVQSSWGTGPGPATQTLLYFLSDGNPEPISRGLDLNETAAWESFLTGKVDASYAVGIGADINTINLEPIAWTPANAALPPLQILNGTELGVALSGALPGEPSGNILSNDAFGADGGYIKSVTINNVTFTYDGKSTITANGALGVGDSINANGKQITITTDLGGKIVFNFADNGLHLAGDWDYRAPTNVLASAPENFNYTLVDGDGDTSAASLIINVLNVSQAPIGVNSAVSGTEDIVKVFAVADFKFTDVDGNSLQSVVISSLPPAGQGVLKLGGANVTGGQTVSAADISNGLLTFHPAANVSGNAVFSFQVIDNGSTSNGGQVLDTTPNTMTVQVAAVNDAPTANITASSFNATEQLDLTLANTKINFGSVDDVETNGTFTVTLSVTQGILTVTGGNSGISGISGSGTSTVTFDGSMAQINNLLGGVDRSGTEGRIVYNANLDNPAAQTTLTLTVNDNANGGPGSLVHSDTAIINVAGVNDPVDAINDSIITNVTDFSPIHIPNAALLWNDIDRDGTQPSVRGVSGASGGTVAPGVVYDPTVPANATGDRLTANFSKNSNDWGGFDYKDGLFGGTGQNADGSRASSGNGNNGALHIDLGGSNSASRTNMNGAFSNTFTLTAPAIVTLTFDYRAQLSGETDNGENVQVLARIGDQLLGTSGVISQLLGVSNNSAGHDTGWQTYTATISLGAGTHTLDLGGLMTAKNDSNEFADVDFDNVKVTASSPSFGSGSFSYTITDGPTSDTANVTVAGVTGNTINGTSGGEILVGGDGDDILFGNGGNDVLVGGKGNNTLNGGAGADLFILDADKLGAGLQDLIADYDFAEGDAIDISALLGGSGATAATIGQFVDVDASGNVRIDTSGHVSATSDIVATLTGSETGETIRFILDDDGNATNFVI